MRWQKEKDPLAPRPERHFTGAALLPLFGLLALCLSVGSYAVFHEGDTGGVVSRTASYFEEFFEKHDAVAVFLGWEGKGD